MSKEEQKRRAQYGREDAEDEVVMKNGRLSEDQIG